MSKAPVLFVDDEAINLLNMQYLLEDQFVAHTASSGKKALAILEEKEIAVLITDQKMPGMTGVELARQVRQMDKDIPILIVTGYVDNDEVNEAKRTGLVQEVIYKPYSVRAVLETISAYAYPP